MAELVLTGFHAVEERVRNATVNKDAVASMQIFYSKSGPRIKKILEQAKKAGIASSQVDDKTLDDMTKHLGNAERDHRGILVRITGAEAKPENIVDFDNWLKDVGSKSEGRCTL